MFKELEAIIGIQEMLLGVMEASEKDLATARDLINDTLRQASGLTERDLLITLLKAQGTMASAALCSSQHSSAFLKESVAKEREALEELKEKLRKMEHPGLNGDGPKGE